MGTPEAVIVSSFNGIRRAGRTGRISTRRQLDTPLEMYNFHLTREGHLYMPRAAPELIYDFSADGEIKTIHYIEEPQGYVVQMTNGKIYHLGISGGEWATDPLSPTLLATIPSGEHEEEINVLTVRQQYSLISYCPRGTAGPVNDGETWKVEGSPSAPTTTNVRATLGRASDQTMYKGRRFWVGRGRTVEYSPLNEPDQAAEGSFQVAGDDAGESYVENPGFVQGLISWEDVLFIFMTGSVWVLTGSSPENWKLRESQSVAGNNNDRTLLPTTRGVYGVGGNNINDRGVYLFSGQSERKVSDSIDDWMKNPGILGSTISSGRIILRSSRANEGERQFVLFDTRSEEWTAFDGWINGDAVVFLGYIYVSKQGVLYRSLGDIFPRAPGRSARYVSGWQDNENPTGLNRYIALKVSGEFYGTGTPTITVTVSTPESLHTTAPIDIPSDVFDGMVIPLNLRAAAIQIELEVTPANDDNEVLIENMQLIVSRKGEKVSRG